MSAVLANSTASSPTASFADADRPPFEVDFVNTMRPHASPRAAVELTRYWTTDEVAREDFTEQLRDALLQALDALGEKPAAVGRPNASP